MFKDSGIDDERVVFGFHLRVLAKFNSCCIFGNTGVMGLNHEMVQLFVDGCEHESVGALFCVRDRSVILDEGSS